MDTISAFLLGMLQGLTEFLPVSSSGHLVLGQKILGIKFHDLNFDILVHLATLLVVIWVYRNIIKVIISDLFVFLKTKKIQPGARLFFYVCVASVPTGIIGILFKDYFESLFSNLALVSSALFVTGILLFITKFKKRGKEESLLGLNLTQDLIEDLSFKKALFLGFAQSIAITPGISRSGTTIAIAVLLGIRPTTAAMFSFMMAIPAILGAFLLQLRHMNIEQMTQSYLIVGFISSLFFGYFGLKGILLFVKKQRLEYFSIYLWTISILSFFL